MLTKIGETDCYPDDSQLKLAIERYLVQLETGRGPDAQTFVAQFPEIAEQLLAHLQGLEFIHRVAPQLREVDGDGANTAPGQIPSLATLGDFRILREIGRGGMGVVFEAEQLSMGRKVALKVLPFAVLIDEKPLKRFRNEVRAAATLDHPNIVSIYSVGEERGVDYYAMQLIGGQSLASVIAQLRSRKSSPDRSSADERGPSLLTDDRRGIRESDRSRRTVGGGAGGPVGLPVPDPARDRGAAEIREDTVVDSVRPSCVGAASHRHQPLPRSPAHPNTWP